jgi:hypothetical protein
VSIREHVARTARTIAVSSAPGHDRVRDLMGGKRRDEQH